MGVFNVTQKCLAMKLYCNCQCHARVHIMNISVVIKVHLLRAVRVAAVVLFGDWSASGAPTFLSVEATTKLILYQIRI